MKKILHRMDKLLEEAQLINEHLIVFYDQKLPPSEEWDMRLDNILLT